MSAQPTASRLPALEVILGLPLGRLGNRLPKGRQIRHYRMQNGATAQVLRYSKMSQVQVHLHISLIVQPGYQFFKMLVMMIIRS